MLKYLIAANAKVDVQDKVRNPHVCLSYLFSVYLFVSFVVVVVVRSSGWMMHVAVPRHMTCICSYCIGW